VAFTTGETEIARRGFIRMRRDQQKPLIAEIAEKPRRGRREKSTTDLTVKGIVPLTAKIARRLRKGRREKPIGCN
jgi:hypothetical protein